MNPSEDLTLNYHMITAIMVIGNESIGQFNSNYHMVTAMMVVNCHAKSRNAKKNGKLLPDFFFSE